MTMRFQPSGKPTPRGSAAVGVLGELPDMERAAILGLRAWCDGADGGKIIAASFATVLGPAKVDAACAGFGGSTETVLRCARRPLMRHMFGCACVGGDESAFANVVAASAVDNREHAVLFASLLVGVQSA